MSEDKFHGGVSDPSHRSESGGFSRFGARAAWLSGSPPAFIAAVVLVVVWGVTGPWFHYSDTWQLIANTVTNVITFLMVFIIQNSQNRDSKAINLKLDELILAGRNARNDMIDIEGLSEEELERLAQRYERIRKQHRKPPEGNQSAA